MQICKTSNIYYKIKLLSKKSAKTKSVRTMINYTCLKNPWPSVANSKYLQNFEKLNVYARKIEKKLKHVEIQWLEVGLNIDLVWHR